MESRTLSLLEFPKVLERLSQLAVSEPAATACRLLTPFGDPALLAREQRKLTEALELRRDAAFIFTPFPDLEPLFPILESERQTLDLDALVALFHDQSGLRRPGRGCLFFEGIRSGGRVAQAL